LELSEALLRFAFVSFPDSPQRLREAALKSLGASPVAFLFGSEHADREGMTLARAPGADLKGLPNDAWLRSRIAQQMRLRREISAAGSIEPVRALIGTRHAPRERHFWPIVTLSPFVPPEQAALFALGFTRFFQGDLMSAAYLLLPQMELRFATC
jgi:hypothetical protein